MTTKDFQRRARGKIRAPHKLKIFECPIDEIHPYIGNPRTHPPKQERKLAERMREFGFINPILIDEQGFIVAGHTRWGAARLALLRRFARAFASADERSVLLARVGARLLPSLGQKAAGTNSFDSGHLPMIAPNLQRIFTFMFPSKCGRSLVIKGFVFGKAQNVSTSWVHEIEAVGNHSLLSSYRAMARNNVHQ